MIGKVSIKKVNSITGGEEIIFEDENQLTEGIKHAIVNVLTGTGSTDPNDYKFSYYQLGDQKYDLSTYDISADVTASAFKSYFWTLKSPLTISQYGKDSKWGVTSKNTYMLGSVYPSGLGTTRAIDNFVQPPDIRTINNEYSNIFALQPLGFTSGLDGTTLLSSTWIGGCADAWEADTENYGVPPMSSMEDLTMSGPDFKSPVWKMSYTPDRYLIDSLGDNSFDTLCIRPHLGYAYHANNSDKQKGETMVVYSKLKNNQTHSAYFAGVNYTSGSAELSSTPLTGRIQMFNRFAQTLLATSAGQNRTDFLYRYDYGNADITFTPTILDVSSGWQRYNAGSEGLATTKFEEIYGFPDTEAASEAEYGIVSGNIYNRYGAVYTFSDHENGYITQNGPGAAHLDTSNAGFGPSGNFYRASITWANPSDKMINFYKGYGTGAELEGQGLVPFMYPIVSSVSGIVSGTSPAPNFGGDIIGHLMPETTPRAAAYVSFQQWDYNSSAQPNQYVHGERSYYLTEPQDFVSIPMSYSTNLLTNTTNIRLEVDENLANSQTIREVGLFLKNPSGATGKDAPFLAAYKLLPCDINKTSEFSYIIDWELSFTDTSVSYTEQSGASEECTSSQ